MAFWRLTREGTPTALGEVGALYRGDLLAGISVDEPGFEDWLRVERERLRDLAIDVRELDVGPSAETEQLFRQLVPAR